MESCVVHWTLVMSSHILIWSIADSVPLNPVNMVGFTGSSFCDVILIL